MGWLKKIWGFLTNPSFNVVRILAVVALGMFIILFLIYITLFISAMRERNRFMTKYQEDVKAAEKPRVTEKILELTFSVNESKKIGTIVLVDVTMHNLGDQQAHFNPGNFRMKDERMMLCNLVNDAHLLEKEKKSALTSINVSPKEDVRGIIMFSCTDPDVKQFTLIYQNTTEKIVPKEFK
jgi:hypothetical protein